ncbi:MAG TPA: GGDEF domain-containing protein [Acidimicrobiales bacterium]|nr:GGDEF domain-containing protein [Acidimicrobiales bacterium]
MPAVLRSGDCAGPNGGEEFLVILLATGLDGATAIAERIRVAISEITIPGVDANVSASPGVASYPQHASTADRLERLADAALYVAKGSGRNRIEVANPAPDPFERPRTRRSDETPPPEAALLSVTGGD